MKLPITFLTDYGYEDEFAGACRIVIERVAPGTPVLDLTHGIPQGDVRRGALALEAVVGGSGPAVHLAVVDPGVGTARRGVAIGTADGSYFVGPDNGLFSLALRMLGGAKEVVDVSATPLRLEPVAPTFHGRDIFAPVAAHLALGLPLEEAGEPVGPSTLIELALPAATTEGCELVGHVLYADSFGNLIIDADPSSLSGRTFTVTSRTGSHRAVRGRTFADGNGGLVLYGDSSGRLGLALDGGSAADLLGASSDDEVRIAPE